MANSRCRSGVPIWLLLAAVCCGVSGAHDDSEEEEPAKKTGWFNETELSLVTTRGNVDTDTLGLKNKLRRLWLKARFQFRVEGVRSDSGGIRTAVANDPTNPDPDDFRVEESGRVTDLDTWLVEARYDRTFSPRTFWNVGTSWDKNQSAGIDSRYQIFATIGNIWWDRDDLKFETSYGLMYANRTEAIDDPRKNGTFPGLRFDWGYRNEITKNSVYTNDLTLNMSIDDTDDWWGNMTNGFTVGLSDRLAVRIGLQLLWNNLPALEFLPFRVDDSSNCSDDSDEFRECPSEVITEKGQLDILFTTALVVSF